ncbi:MAG: PDZ domain-containing protein, partial [Deltaproteobacteria bacterium]|nr:PDZ domain-containing protein [Deltaproteobacteria bacterium]
LEGNPGVTTAGDTTRIGQPRLLPLAKYETMVERSLFGTKAEATGAPTKALAPGTQSLPITESDFRLKGTIVTDSEGRGSAILEDWKSKQQDLYRVGQRVGSAELIKVERSQVTLKQGEKEILLKINEGDSKDAPGRSEGLLPGAPGSKGPASAPGGDQIGREVGPNQYVISREALGRRINDFNYFLSSVNIQPNFADGVPKGFKIASISPGGPVYQLGLRANDIILSVNGISVANVED